MSRREMDGLLVVFGNHAYAGVLVCYLLDKHSSVEIYTCVMRPAKRHTNRIEAIAIDIESRGSRS